LFQGGPLKVESLGEVPINFSLVHLGFEDGDELLKLENSAEIPLNFRL